MRRRAFLGTLAAVTAGAVFDPELALWIPGRKTYIDLGPSVVPLLVAGQFVWLTERPVAVYPKDIDGKVLWNVPVKSLRELHPDRKYGVLGVMTESAMGPRGTVWVQVGGSSRPLWAHDAPI